MTMRGLRSATLLAAMLCWISGAAAVDIATVAKTGDLAPGTGGAILTVMRTALVNGAGEVMFIAGLEGSDVTSENDEGIWAGRPGALVLVARKGALAPGAGGAVFNGFTGGGFTGFNAAGEVAFNATLKGSGVTPANNDGIWAGRPGALVLVARKGALAPGAAGAVFGPLFEVFFRLSTAGEIGFRAELTGIGVTPANDGALWAGPPGGLVLVARHGDPAPGTGGALFDGFVGPALNGAGELAFRGILTGAGVTAANDESLWAGPLGGPTLVAREGKAAPDAGGAVFGFLDFPALNGAGEMAFLADLTGSGVTAANDKGVWVGPPGDPALVVRAGDPAPGAGGAVFDQFFLAPLNGAGELALFASVTGSDVTTANEDGIWVGPRDALVLAARQGAAAPGIGGAVFDRLFDVGLNGVGELVFSGRTLANIVGLWAGLPDGLQLIVRTGGAIEVAPGLFKTVSDFSLGLFLNGGNEGGGLSTFSEGGQSVFRAEFTDGSEGIFLSPPDPPKAHRVPYRAIDGRWDQVMLPRTFRNPVIIAGPPSFANRQPGVVRMRRIDGTNGRFEARFQEWRYLDGMHPEERVDVLALERGRHVMADGSIWEAGIVRVAGNRNWRRQRFSRRFPGAPRVFVTVQSFRGRTPVAARVRNVTRTSFEVSIQEEERDLGTRHPRETVGFLAIFSPGGRGTIAGGVNGTDYRLGQARVNHRFRRVLGERIKLEEERSLDRERRHTRERVSVMTLGRGLFAQQASNREADTTAIRRR